MPPFYKKKFPVKKAPVAPALTTPANVPAENRFWIPPEQASALSTYIGPKGYSILKSGVPPDVIERLKKALSARPIKGGPVPSTVVYPVYTETAEKLFIPYYFARETGFPPSPPSYLSPGVDIDITFAQTLRPAQIPVLQSFIELVETSTDPIRGGMLHLPCAWGKTAGTMFLISHFKKRALVLINQENLADQWIERVDQFIPGATIGRIQGDIFDIEKDIVIAMINTISSRKYPADAFSSFGFFVVDEAHFIGSKEFSKALKSITIPITLGLTASMNRADGLIWMIQQYLGPVHCSVKRDDVHLDVQIKAIHYRPLLADTEEFMEPILSSTGELMMSSMISKICKYKPYQTFVLDHLREFIRVPEWTERKQRIWEQELAQTRVPCIHCGRPEIHLVNTTCCKKKVYCYQCLHLFLDPLGVDDIVDKLHVYSLESDYIPILGTVFVAPLPVPVAGKRKTLPTETQSQWIRWLKEIKNKECVLLEDAIRVKKRETKILDILRRMKHQNCLEDEVLDYVYTHYPEKREWLCTSPDVSKTIKEEPCHETIRKDMEYLMKIAKGKHCPCCNAKTRIGFEQCYVENALVEPYQKRQTILFANCRQILLDLYQTIIDHNLASVGLYIGNTVDVREIKKSKLKDAEQKQVILATYSMAGTGLDIPTLNAAFFLTSKANIEQPAGRPMRKAHVYPTVIYDFIWPHACFKRQYTSKRRPYYRTNKYAITEIHVGKKADDKEEDAGDYDIDGEEEEEADYACLLDMECMLRK
jgi:superfamily II DNA or RNA helicase